MSPTLPASGCRRGEMPAGAQARGRLADVAAGQAAGIRRVVEELPLGFATPSGVRERPGLGNMAAF